jgi:hypothetical protein
MFIVSFNQQKLTGMRSQVEFNNTEAISHHLLAIYLLYFLIYP